MTLVLAALLSLQETAGQEYLDQLGKAWTAKLPSEQLLGIYVGSKWMGSAKFAVEDAPKDSGARFRVTFTGDMALGEKKMKQKSVILLSGTLAPVSSESEEVDGEDVTKKKLAVEGGRWTLTTDKNGTVTTQAGDVQPGLVDDDIVPCLLFHALPARPEATTLLSIGKDKRHVVRPGAAKRTLTIGGKTVECTTFEWTSGDESDKSILFVGPEGRLLQASAREETVHIRAIQPSEIGKDLPEKGALSPPAKAVLSLFVAIKKCDKEAIEGLFDWERLTSEMVPNYATMTPEQQKAAQKDMHERLMDAYTNGKMAKSLPKVEELEAMLGPVMKVTEKDGKADVNLGGNVFRLYRVEEGDRKGTWVIYAVKK